MDSLFRPVGPSPPAIYWRRRVVMAALVVVVSYFLVKACTPDATGADLDRSAQSTRQTSPDSAPAPSGETPSDAQPEPSAEESVAESPPSGDATQVSGGGGGTAPGYCGEENIRIDVRPNKREYGPSESPVFTLLVFNVGSAPCKFDVGPTGWSVEIMTDQTPVWLSDHCAGEEAEDVQTLNRLTPASIDVQWDRRRSEQGCPTGAAAAEAGTYTVTATAGETISPKAIFVLG